MINQSHQGVAAALNLVSPLATLGRGYALVHRYPDGPLTRDAGQLQVGDRIQVRLAKGSLLGRVERIEPGD
jgi:exodeoxyribonuclease VII large subunit